MRATRSGKKLGLVSTLIALMAGVTGALPAGSVQSDVYSSTATLGDGVEGLDLSRTTTVESQVWTIEQVGEFMLVGGAFTHVRDRSSFDKIPRPYLAAFDPSTGEYVPWFATQPDGPVYDIVNLGDGRAAVLGEFSSINSVEGTGGVAIIDTTTGLVETNYSIELNPPDTSAARAGVLHDGFLYITGSFDSLRANGVSAGGAGVARIDLSSGGVDSSFAPTLRGGGWDIDVASSGRVFVGGYFTSVNNLSGTETLAALNPDGTVVTGWNHGFPHGQCALGVFNTCGVVTGLAVANDRLFVAGAKHFWAAMSIETGEVLADRKIPNDGQSVDLVDGLIVIGCHCSLATTSDEFDGIEDRYIRVIDPELMIEVESPTVNSKGAAGGWAAAPASDGCLWVGGNFSSTVVERRVPAWNLLRFCRNSGLGVNPQLGIPSSIDRVAPGALEAPTVVGQRASSVSLEWAASAEASGQVVYNVYRNGRLTSRTSGTTYLDQLLDPNSIYYWQVMAEDLAGTLGPMSARSQPLEIGPRYNAAIKGTATQFSVFDTTTTADKAIDGITDGVLANGSVARTGTAVGDARPWWNLDLGSLVDVDFVEVHPRSDAGFAETNNRLRIFHDNEPIIGDNVPAVARTAVQVWIGDSLGTQPVVEKAELATSARYLRIFNDATNLSLAEVRVFTVDALPVPPAPAADTTEPIRPVWSRVQSRGANSVLSWGGAIDDTAVAFYRIYDELGFLHSTTNQSISVGEAGQRASNFTVVAYDAAGNHSLLPIDNHPLRNTSRFVTQSYSDFLARDPLAVEMHGWTTDIDTGKRTRTDLATHLLLSAEYTDIADPNIRLYEAYFHRLPDAGGLKYWMDVRRSGYSIDLVSDQFTLSAEFQNTYGDTTDAEFIRRVYLNVLNREPDAAGYEYWQDLLIKRFISRGQLMVNFSESAEYRNGLAARVRIVGTYIALLNRIPSAAELEVEELNIAVGKPPADLVGQILGGEEYDQRFRR